MARETTAALFVAREDLDNISCCFWDIHAYAEFDGHMTKFSNLSLLRAYIDIGARMIESKGTEHHPTNNNKQTNKEYKSKTLEQKKQMCSIDHRKTKVSILYYSAIASNAMIFTIWLWLATSSESKGSIW